MTDAAAALGALWRWAGEEPRALEQATLSGGDPVLPGNFKIATAAMASIAAAGLAAAELWRLRTGRRQRVTVDARAAATAFRSERYLRVDGRPPGDTWHPVSGFHRAGDGRFILLHCNLPHLREGALRVLGCDATREAVAAAVGGWKAAELEDTLAAPGWRALRRNGRRILRRRRSRGCRCWRSRGSVTRPPRRAALATGRSAGRGFWT